MTEFFISRTPGKATFEVRDAADALVADGFATPDTAADMVVRFAQDQNLTSYRYYL